MSEEQLTLTVNILSGMLRHVTVPHVVGTLNVGKCYYCGTIGTVVYGEQVEGPHETYCPKYQLAQLKQSMVKPDVPQESPFLGTGGQA